MLNVCIIEFAISWRPFFLAKAEGQKKKKEMGGGEGKGEKRGFLLLLAKPKNNGNKSIIFTSFSRTRNLVMNQENGGILKGLKFHCVFPGSVCGGGGHCYQNILLIMMAVPYLLLILTM